MRETETGIGHPKTIVGCCKAPRGSGQTHICKAAMGMGVTRSGVHPSRGTGTEIGGPKLRQLILSVTPASVPTHPPLAEIKAGPDLIPMAA